MFISRSTSTTTKTSELQPLHIISVDISKDKKTPCSKWTEPGPQKEDNHSLSCHVRSYDKIQEHKNCSPNCKFYPHITHDKQFRLALIEASTFLSIYLYIGTRIEWNSSTSVESTQALILFVRL